MIDYQDIGLEYDDPDPMFNEWKKEFFNLNKEKQEC
jgi:hypothetical protein